MKVVLCLVIYLSIAQVSLAYDSGADYGRMSAIDSLRSLWMHTDIKDPSKVLSSAPSISTSTSAIRDNAPSSSSSFKSSTKSASTTASSATITAGNSKHPEVVKKIEECRLLRKQLLLKWAECLNKYETDSSVGIQVTQCREFLENSLKLSKMISENLKKLKSDTIKDDLQKILDSLNSHK